jgi:hypothetical protein
MTETDRKPDLNGEMRSPPYRRRLPNRREAVTETLVIGNMVISATVGFDEAGAPKEIFLDGGKTGSAMDFLLGDAAVAISICLQYGVSAQALAKSIARVPESLDGPATTAASALGVAIDLLVECENARSALPQVPPAH